MCTDIKGSLHEFERIFSHSVLSSGTGPGLSDSRGRANEEMNHACRNSHFQTICGIYPDFFSPFLHPR